MARRRNSRGRSHSSRSRKVHHYHHRDKSPRSAKHVIHHSARDKAQKDRLWFYIEFGIPYAAIIGGSLYLLDKLGFEIMGPVFGVVLFVAIIPSIFIRKKLDKFFDKISDLLN